MKWLVILIAAPIGLILLLAIGRGNRRRHAVRLFLDFLRREWPQYQKLSEIGHTLTLTHNDGGEYELNTLQLANAIARTDGSTAAIDAVFSRAMRQLDEAEKNAISEAEGLEDA